ncbi:MAG: hypothetical protein ABI811_22685 [Acidobacteriota bacterium]
MQTNQLDGSSISVAAQVDRILQSQPFRNAESLRRLLRFLADRSAGEAVGPLKEYAVGVEGLGKTADYDPRSDSSVRIQVGRLRQKLAEYYRTEGLHDPLIVEIPKGQFNLTWAPRPDPADQPHTAEAGVKPTPLLIRGLVIGLVLTSVWAGVASYQLRNERQGFSRSMWTSELRQLWASFLSGQRPVIIAIEDPPFVQFGGAGTYREMWLNTWEDIEKSPRVAAIRKLLGDPEMTPSHYYAPIGEASAAFVLGRFLGPLVPTLSLSAGTDLSWSILASHNVIYIGASVFFNDRFNALPGVLDFNYAPGGITNARPGPGDLEFYPERSANASENGELYAIVTHIAGPSGAGDMTSFTSMRTPGRLGAVQWFTDAAAAKELIGHLKNSTGKVPRNYQVLLRVKFRDSVPTQTSYVTHHILSESARIAQPAN